MTDLDATLATLRRHGVQTYEGPDLKVTFFDRPAAPPPDATAPKPPEVDDEDAPCGCGHTRGDHVGGGCLQCACEAWREPA